MKKLVVFIICFSCCRFLVAQPLINADGAANPTGTRNTYALIIGVSKYADADINQLQFANRDAVIFADFLMSAPGGSVPRENIKLLIDSNATKAEVETAIITLKNKCGKDDNVFFYFSGHGALENETIFKDGYLICYNTPAVAFKNMGLSIDWLNKMASTIALEKNANVVIITDACHSGRTARSEFKGSFFVGQQLMETKQKEIRIASCTPMQSSIEKEEWGGGRGVFSYYLVNGLRGGLADRNNNGSVTLGELRAYLDTALGNDQVLKNEKDTQTAVIDGRDNFILSIVVPAEAAKIKQAVAEDSASIARLIGEINAVEAEGPQDPEEYFFSLLKKESLESLTEKLQLDSLTAEAIAFSLINEFASRGLTPTQLIKLKILETKLKDDPGELKTFNLKLSIRVNDRGADVIRQYLKVSVEEMERRSYYNTEQNGYDIYPKLFTVALKLAQGDEYRANCAAIFLHYFTGVMLRLKVPVSADPSMLIEQALAEQNKALALDEYASYIQNELGILCKYKKNYAEAEKYYKRAAELSPDWAMPYSNLCGLYGLLKKYDSATAACSKADSLQKNLLLVSLNWGILYERQNNQLFAEESYQHAIEINSRHYIPFERLGVVYLKTTDYALSDSFFYEAGLRKAGFPFANPPIVRDSLYPHNPDQPDNTPPCPHIANFRPNDIFLLFTQALQFVDLINPEPDTAETLLKRVIELDKRNPLAYHYLGKMYYDGGKWEQAELMFKNAMLYYLDGVKFQGYFDAVKASVKYPYPHSCYDNYFFRKHYDRKEDYYFAIAACESWKHMDDAELYLRKLIVNMPQEKGGYLKLYHFLEKQGRYAEAEQVINSFAVADKERSAIELDAFYERMIVKFPRNGDWYYRLGLLLYNRAAYAASIPYLDSIVWAPRLNQELFIDVPLFNALERNRDLVSAPVTLQPKISEHTDLYYLPGTNEELILAGAILTPRKDGIQNLLKAAEWISEKETLADIYFKVANMYLWAGSKKQAWPYYAKSLELVPENANTRLALVNIYSALHKNQAALEQLNYLYDSGQSNLQKRLLLARFNMLAGGFGKAGKILDEARSVYPTALPEITRLQGLSMMLADKPEKAITFYEKYLQNGRLTAGQKRMPAYTLAGLYAKTGKINEALIWLEKAINYGFNYTFVLQLDPLMDKLRKTEKWRTLFSSISIKKYKPNYIAN